MNIHYTDIAAESETATLDTSNFADVGRVSFMRWFRDCAENGLTVDETPYAHVLKAHGDPIDFNNFNFSESPKLCFPEKVRDLKNRVAIRTFYTDRVSIYNPDSASYTYKGQTTGDCISAIGFDDELAAELHVRNVQEDNLIYPEIYVLKHLQFGVKPESTNKFIRHWQARYEAYKTLIGDEIIHDPRYGANVVYLGRLDIDPSNDIEVVNSISF